MTSDRGHDLVRRSWTLLLGPGASLAECAPLLRTLADASPRPAPAGIEQLENWNALFCEFSNEGRIVVDVDTIRLEHLGLLRGFLERRGGWELTLVGQRGDASVVRELAGQPRSVWYPGSLDVAWMKALLVPPGGSPAADATPLPQAAHESAPAAPPEAEPDRAPRTERRSAAPQRPGPSAGDAPLEVDAPELGEDDELLAQVERILRGEATAPPGGATGAATAAPAAPKLEVLLSPAAEAAELPELDGLDLEFDPFAEVPEERGPDRTPHEPDVATAPSDRETPAPPAPYFRHQVADLADLVQCVDLGLGLATEELADQGGPASVRLAERLQELGGEVARLRQFTNTLSFLVAPPGAGTQRFDLAPLLEEMLTARRSEPEAPRYLIRTPEPLEIQSDKMLISQALDALLFLAHHAAGPGGTVRLDGRHVAAEDGDGEEVLVSIRFPAGRFADRTPARLLEPYGLRRDLPELGANALAAASGLLRGQGGRVELRAEAGDGLEWRVHLPATS